MTNEHVREENDDTLQQTVSEKKEPQIESGRKEEHQAAQLK